MTISYVTFFDPAGANEYITRLDTVETANGEIKKVLYLGYYDTAGNYYHYDPETGNHCVLLCGKCRPGMYEKYFDDIVSDSPEQPQSESGTRTSSKQNKHIRHLAKAINSQKTPKYAKPWRYVSKLH